MRFALGMLVVLLNVADNTTTFLCLRAPVPGYEVSEANPAAAWLFGTIGLVPGLAFELVVTSSAIAFLVMTTHVPPRVKLALLFVLAALPAWAVINNTMVIRTTGLAFGWSS
ncbi:MAG TPA: hypothetical protein VMR31_17640 [Myxococcota bacterium]|nr:hypothetical protein [Myxococcota bacterium]